MLKSCILLALLILLRSPTVRSKSIGCLYLRDDQSIRCQNTSLEDIGESLYILTMVVMNKPQVVDIDYCGGMKELAPIFDSINATIDTVRIRRSGLQSIHPDAFRSLTNSLRDLDLSYNMLQTIPKALASLWYLEHLNLQHNRIVFVRPGSIFDAIPNLREINLANNYIGLVDDKIDNITEKHQYQLKGNVGLDVFSLGKVVLSLESLNLRDNRLAALPVQISGSEWPELRHLDISENVISELSDTLTLEFHPMLEFLDVHSNRIQSIRFYSLPVTLRYLDFTDNPLHCDCAVGWIYEWSQSNSTTVRLPACNTPERFRGLELFKVPWSVECDTQPLRYVKKANGGYDVLQLHSSATAINVSWKVKMDGSNKKWKVVYRKENDSPYQMTLSSPSQRNAKSKQMQDVVLTDRIQNLDPETVYIVCITVIEDGKYTIEPNRCQKIRTKTFEEMRGTQNETEWEDQKNIITELLDIGVSSESIHLKWKLRTNVPLTVDKDETTTVRHEWTLRIRRTGSDNYTDIPVFDITQADDTNEQLYEYSIPDLAPRTHYDICLIDVDHHLLTGTMETENSKLYEPRTNQTTVTCKTVVTSGNYVLYATEIAAIALACGICFVVIIVTVYLCRQKRLLNWKPKTLTSWLREISRSERPQPIGCSTNKFGAGSIPRAKWKTTSPDDEIADNKASVGTWNTLRMPYQEFPQVDNSNLGIPSGYKNALTTVTIYSSGHSEC